MKDLNDLPLKDPKETEAELRKEYFDGPASDSMSFEQFLMRKGRGDLIRPDVGGTFSGTKRLPGGGTAGTRGYKKGGEVTKRKTKKKTKNVMRGTGAAIRGTKFSGVF